MNMRKPPLVMLVALSLSYGVTAVVALAVAVTVLGPVTDNSIWSLVLCGIVGTVLGAGATWLSWEIASRVERRPRPEDA